MYHLLARVATHSPKFLNHSPTLPHHDTLSPAFVFQGLLIIASLAPLYLDPCVNGSTFFPMGFNALLASLGFLSSMIMFMSTFSYFTLYAYSHRSLNIFMGAFAPIHATLPIPKLARRFEVNNI